MQVGTGCGSSPFFFSVFPVNRLVPLVYDRNPTTLLGSSWCGTLPLDPSVPELLCLLQQQFTEGALRTKKISWPFFNLKKTVVISNLIQGHVRSIPHLPLSCSKKQTSVTIAQLLICSHLQTLMVSMIYDEFFLLPALCRSHPAMQTPA